MKTIFTAFLFMLLCSAAWAQTSSQTVTRIRDATGTTTYAQVGQLTLTIPTTTYALAVEAGVYFYDGANMHRWLGGDLGSDAIAAANIAPYTAGFNFYYSTSTVWRRQIGGPLADNLLSTRDMPYTGAYNLFRNSVGDVYQRWTGEAIDAAISATEPVAPFVGAYSLFWDGAAIERWAGETLDDVGTAAAPTLPWVGAYNLFYDGSLARRWTGEAVDDSMTAAPVSPWVAAYNIFYDGTNARRTTGEAYDSSMTAAPVNANTNAFSVFYNGANSQYWQGSVLSGETVANSTYAPHIKNFNYGYDATAGLWRWVNVSDVQADGKATTLNGFDTTSFMYAYNAGTATLNMLRLGSANELYVQDISVRAGESPADDWVKTRKESVSTTSPDATVGTAVTGGAGLTIVLAARDVSQDLNWCVYLKNTDAADAFTNAAIETSPNNSDWTSDLGWTACDSLAASATCSYCVNGSAFKYIRVRVSSAADVTVTAWYFGNRG